MRAHIRIPQAGNLTIGGRLEPSSTMEDIWRTVVSGEIWDSSRYTPSSDSTAERSSMRPRESRSRSMPRVEPWEIRAASRRLSSAMMLIRSRAPVGGVEEGRGDEGVDCSAPRRIVSMTTWFLTFRVWGAREVFVGPDGETVNSLLFCELRVCPVYGLSGGVGVVNDKGGVNFYRRAFRETYNYCVLDARVFDQHGLNVLGEYVLAAGEDDHVLDPALDVEEAVLVEVAEVSGLVPPIFECLGGFFGGVVIAGGDVIAFYQDFALLADLDLYVGQGSASRVGAALIHSVIADHG